MKMQCDEVFALTLMSCQDSGIFILSISTDRYKNVIVTFYLLGDFLGTKKIPGKMLVEE